MPRPCGCDKAAPRYFHVRKSCPPSPNGPPRSRCLALTSEKKHAPNLETRRNVICITFSQILRRNQDAVECRAR